MSRRARVGVALIAGFYLLVPAGCKSPSGETQTGTIASPIVGGAASTDFPAVGFINVGNENGCSGVLITPSVVLTAAHCFATFYRAELPDRPPVWFFTGAVGSSAPIRAERVVVHADTQCLFTKTSRDLAYIVLSTPVIGIEPLQIERARHTPHCEYTDVGYGSAVRIFDAGDGEDDGGPGSVIFPLCEGSDARPAEKPRVYREGDAPVIPIRERKALVTCADDALSTHGYVTTHSDAGSVCVGDSGSPLIDLRTKKIVGIASATAIDEAGTQCDYGSKAYFAPVFSRAAFIDEALAAKPASEGGNGGDAGPEATDEGCAAAPRAASSSGDTIPAGAGVLSVLALSWFVIRRRKRVA